MNRDDIETMLRNPQGHSAEDRSTATASLADLKADAVARGDQDVAKALWCLETVVLVQDGYIAAFEEMRAGAFYDAWCRLASVEVDLNALARHHPLTDYSLAFIAAQTERFQALFPYKLFLSPGFIVDELRCGLCDTVLTPRNGCDHRKGEIYDGEMCFHEITEARGVEVSFVKTPVDKACIGFVIDPSTGKPIEYDYSAVSFVVTRLESPFSGWDLTWTRTRHPHEFFRDVAKDAACPCESGGAYENCCLPETGVLRPHCQIVFENDPPPDSPSLEYVYSDAVPG